MKELQMPKYQFYNTLIQMLEMYEVLRDKYKTADETIDHVVNMYDDFYEFLEHWEDYKETELGMSEEDYNEVFASEEEDDEI